MCLTCITDSSLLESEFSEALIVSGSRWLFKKIIIIIITRKREASNPSWGGIRESSQVGVDRVTELINLRRGGAEIVLLRCRQAQIEDSGIRRLYDAQPPAPPPAPHRRCSFQTTAAPRRSGEITRPTQDGHAGLVSWHDGSDEGGKLEGNTRFLPPAAGPGNGGRLSPNTRLDTKYKTKDTNKCNHRNLHARMCWQLSARPQL